MGSLTPPKLLVVDFTNKEVLKPGSGSWASACKDIRRALENRGFFIPLYDEVSPELDKANFHAAAELFDLPTEVKAKNTYEKPFHGYVGQNPLIPLHEALGIDYATTHEGVQSFANLMWPKGNDSFSEISFSFAKTQAKLYEMVTKMLLESYGVAKYSDSHVDSTTYLLRFPKYRAPEMNENTKGIASYTDITFLTILYQNHIPGLEIRTRDGEWITVHFPPKSFVVLAGMSARVLSPAHKVTVDANRKETRYTIGLFSSLDKIVEVPEKLVDEQNALQFKPFHHQDLINFNATNQGQRSENMLKDFCGV
ncbi:hypothetical protein ACH5RR_015784 [Cinchona calisaya]|uniref:Fe2OG dioxygenase domain-containing protein n=1 Tax=Cinchona calisaya TaxID=153742 RepID=A0ABD2ZU23_9GENT